MSTQFSLAYTCARAYAYVLVKTRLNVLDEDRDCNLAEKGKIAHNFFFRKTYMTFVQVNFLSLSYFNLFSLKKTWI